MDNKNSFNFDTIEILVFLWKKKMPIILITALGAITSIIVSLSIEEKYKSNVVLFPATTGALSNMVLTNNVSKADLLRFGEDEDMERILQVLRSNEIKDRIIEKYNLREHYEIDPNSKYPRTSIYEEFNGNIKYNKTPYQSVEITVLDKDPIIAANIANDMANLIDTLINEMQRVRALEAYQIVQKAYKEKYEYITRLEDSLEVVRKQGILDYFLEVERYSEAYGKAVGNNTINPINNAVFQEKFDILAENGDLYNTLKDIITFEKRSLVDLNEKVIETRVNAENIVSQKYVVEEAQPAEKKSYPVRWLIVVASTLSAFAFSIILAILLDLFKSLRKRLQEGGDEVVG